MIVSKYFSKDNITTESFVKKRINALNKSYKLLKKISTGVYGSVYLLEDIKLKEKRVLKLFSKNYYIQKSEETFQNELRINKRLDHPNICKVYEWFEDKLFYYIVMEYLEGGELLQYVTNNKLSEKQICKIMKKLLTAVNYIHSNNIIHRDIKLDNLLLKIPDDIESIKIIDFGIAIEFNNEEEFFEDRAGTDYYMAPELIRNIYNKKIDIWACGVVFYILMCGNVPFDGTDYIEIFENILDKELEFEENSWKNSSEEVEELIYLMLMKNQQHRISINEIFEHSWFSKNHENDSATIHLDFFEKFKFLKYRNLLEKTLGLYIVRNFNFDVQKKTLRKVFTAIDLNNDGLIEEEELKTFFSKNSKFHKFDNFIIDFDFSNNQRINYSQFLLLTLNFKKLIGLRDIKKLFLEIDSDHDGFLSEEELKTFLGNSGNDELLFAIMQDIRLLDTNMDRRISFTEFMVNTHLLET